MHEPNPRVIRLEADNQVPVRGQHGHISPRRVLCIDGVVIGIEFRGALGEDDEVVAVEMEGMRDGDGVAVRDTRGIVKSLDDEENPIIVCAVDEEGGVVDWEGFGGRVVEADVG